MKNIWWREKASNKALITGDKIFCFPCDMFFSDYVFWLSDWKIFKIPNAYSWAVCHCQLLSMTISDSILGVFTIVYFTSDFSQLAISQNIVALPISTKDLKMISRFLPPNEKTWFSTTVYSRLKHDIFFDNMNMTSRFMCIKLLI
jgi:hypothetical protein